MIATWTTISPTAMHAIRAAANWRIWGRRNAVMYCRNRGVPMALLRLARHLHVATVNGF